MDLAAEIRKLTEGLLAEGQFLVDIDISSKKGPRKISVVIDGDRGVGIDDCALISRQLSKALDTLDLPDDRYTLEVTTPGVDQPLKFKRQYARHVGRKVRVNSAGRIVEGILSEVADDSITLSVETGKGKKKEVHRESISFERIDKTFVLISFK